MNFITFIFSVILLFSGGFSWFFTKLHSGYSLPVEFSIFYRNFGSAVFLFTIMTLSGRIRIFKLNKEELKVVLVVAFFYYFFYFMGAYHGSKFLAAGIVAFISSTKTIFIELLMAVKERHRPSKTILISAALGSIGIALMSRANMNISNLTLGQIIFGLAFAFVAPISNSISYVVIKTSPAKKTINNFALAMYGFLIGSLLVLVVGLVKYGKIAPMPLERNYIIGWIYLAFGASGLITVISYYLIEHIGPSKTAMMSLAHSPTALLLSVGFMGYTLDWQTTLGMTCCVVALYFGLKYKKKVVSQHKRRKFWNRFLRNEKVVNG